MTQNDSKKRKLSHSNKTTTEEESQSNENQLQCGEIADLIRQRMELDQERLSRLANIESQAEDLKRKELELNIMMELMNLGSDHKGWAKLLQNHPVSKTAQANIESVLSMQDKDSRVVLNVGGQTFVTSKDTINKTDNLLKVVLSTEIPLERDESGAILFPDQNPSYFMYVLDYMQYAGDTSKVVIDEDMDSSELSSLLDELEYFNCSLLAKKVLNLLEKKSDAIKTTDSRKSGDTLGKEQVKNSNNNKLDLEADWIDSFKKLTISQQELAQRYGEDQRNTLCEQILEVEKKKQSSISSTNSHMRLSLRGRQYLVPLSILAKHPDCILPRLLQNSNNEEIFIDKDPDIFQLLLEYMITDKFDHFPHNYYHLKRVKRDAEFFNLKELVSTFFNRFRYPIEALGQRNVQMKKQEDVLRRMFATDRDNPLLNDPYINLLPLFDAPLSELEPDKDTQNIPRIFDFEDTYQRKAISAGTLYGVVKPQICDSLVKFHENWNTFSHGLFEGMDWSNIFAAGGSVLACALNPNPNRENSESENINDDETSSSYVDGDESDDDLYSDDGDEKTAAYASITTGLSAHGSNNNYAYGPFKDSDIDLFLYALTEQEAEEKTNLEKSKPQAVESPYFGGLFGEYGNQQQDNSARKDIFMLRTKSAVTFIFQKPMRQVQVILRIYKSPAEVLIGFDIDSCAIGFDGKQVLSLPRARRAIANRVNIVDVDRQSTTFEIRLFKYAKRGFRVGVPGFHHAKVKNGDLKSLPSKYDIRIKKQMYNQYFGLARLLMLELSLTKIRGLSSLGISDDFRRASHQIQRPPHVKKDNEFELDLNKSDYSEIHVHIPYSGSVYDSFVKRVAFFKKLFADDLDNPLWKPNFLFSLNNPDKIINNSDHDSELSSKIEWLTINPGRQSIGSFHPTDRNFFKDAYSPSAYQKHSKIEQLSDPSITKLYKAQWFQHLPGRRSRTTPLDKDLNRSVEIAYRAYIKNRNLQTFEMPDGSGELNFLQMRVQAGYSSYGLRRDKIYCRTKPASEVKLLTANP